MKWAAPRRSWAVCRRRRPSWSRACYLGVSSWTASSSHSKPLRKRSPRSVQADEQKGSIRMSCCPALVWRLWSADRIWVSFKRSSGYLIKILTQKSLCMMHSVDLHVYVVCLEISFFKTPVSLIETLFLLKQHALLHTFRTKWSETVILLFSFFWSA